MESTGERSVGRRRIGVTLTLTRIVMDNIEWRQVYNEACKHAERITAPDSKQAVMLILQLLNGLYEMIEEMQLQDEC